MSALSEEQFIVSPAGVTHLPTEASFTPNPGAPTTAHWRDGRLGCDTDTGYDAQAVKQRMRHIWAEYLLSQ